MSNCDLKRGRITRGATDHEIIIGLIGALSLHPAMQNPPVFYPPLRQGAKPQQVFVQRYRDFGGTELTEQGLTIAVYPMHTSYELGNDEPSASGSGKFANFSQHTLGRANNQTYYDRGTLQFVVQILYTDATFNAPLELTYGLRQMDEIDKLYETYGRYYTAPTDNKNELPGWDGDTKKVTIRTNPGEVVVRDYTYLVRNVLRSIYKLRPYGIRGIQVDSVDYPSSDWISREGNIVFHNAYITLSVDVYESDATKDPWYIAPDWAENVSAQPDYAKDAKDFFCNLPHPIGLPGNYGPGEGGGGTTPFPTEPTFPDPDWPNFPYVPCYPSPIEPINPTQPVDGVTNIIVNDDRYNETNMDFYPTVHRFLEPIAVDAGAEATLDLNS